MMLRRFVFVGLAVSLSLIGCQDERRSDTTPNKLVTPIDPPTAPAALQPQAPPAAQLSLAVDLSNAVVPADKASEVLVRVRVKGLALVEEKRPALSLALVIDTSGSMEGAAIERAREACQTLVDSLQDGDRVAIVTFGTSARSVVAAQTITSKVREDAKKAIREIRAEGTTNLAGGLSLGVSELQKIMSQGGINRVVLVGDGVPNDATQLPAIAANARALNVPITTLGLGADFDETVMTQIAQTSGGTFHFIDDASRVAGVFKEEIAKMTRVVARGTSVDITPGPGVSILEVLGAPASAITRGSRVTLGDMSEGQTRDIVVRLSVQPTKDGGSVELLDSLLTYQHGLRHVPMTENIFRSTKASKDEGVLSEGRNPEIELQSARLRVAQNIINAIAMARAGDPKGARALLDETARFATKEAKRLSDSELEKKATEALLLKKTVAGLAPLPQPGLVAHAGHPGQPHPLPAPVAAAPRMSAEDAMSIRRSHASAMGEIQSTTR